MGDAMQPAQLGISSTRVSLSQVPGGTLVENRPVSSPSLDDPATDQRRECPRLLISLADAARATGISYNQLGQLAYSGGIEQVKVGSRRYLKRQSLLDFIDRNTYRG